MFASRCVCSSFIAVWIPFHFTNVVFSLSVAICRKGYIIWTYIPIQQWEDSITSPARLIERTQPILGTRTQCTTLMSRPDCQTCERSKAARVLLNMLNAFGHSKRSWDSRTLFLVYVLCIPGAAGDAKASHWTSTHEETSEADDT